MNWRPPMTVKVLFLQRAPAMVEDLRTGYMGEGGYSDTADSIRKSVTVERKKLKYDTTVKMTHLASQTLRIKILESCPQRVEIPDFSTSALLVYKHCLQDPRKLLELLGHLLILSSSRVQRTKTKLLGGPCSFRVPERMSLPVPQDVWWRSLHCASVFPISASSGCCTSTSSVCGWLSFLLEWCQLSGWKLVLNTRCINSFPPQIPHFKSSGETCIYGTVNFAFFWAVLVDKIYVQNR